jgi:hypothetical protein
MFSALPLHLDRNADADHDPARKPDIDVLRDMLRLRRQRIRRYPNRHKAALALALSDRRCQ